MSKPVRKPNRLPDYSYNTPGIYFVTICTEDRKPILSEIVGGGAFDAPHTALTKYGEVVQRHILSGNRIPGVTVEKYVIMPNHIHLLLRIGGTVYSGTSRAPSPTKERIPQNEQIPHFVSTFKRFCHRDIGKPIFQRSYHDHVIREERDYLKIWNYIETNPARWKEDCFYPYKENQS